MPARPRRPGFINFIVKPMFDGWGAFIPEIEEMSLPHVKGNLALWAADVCKVLPDQVFCDEAEAAWDAAEARWVLHPDAAEFTYTDGLLDDAAAVPVS